MADLKTVTVVTPWLGTKGPDLSLISRTNETNVEVVRCRLDTSRPVYRRSVGRGTGDETKSGSSRSNPDVTTTSCGSNSKVNQHGETKRPHLGGFRKLSGDGSGGDTQGEDDRGSTTPLFFGLERGLVSNPHGPSLDTNRDFILECVSP